MAPELTLWRDFFISQDARAILLGYVVAVILSLFPLIPQSLVALGQEMLVVFVFILATSARSAPALLRSSGVYGRGNRWFRGALLVAGIAATLAGGLALVAGQVWPLQLLAASVLVLIVVSVFRTWDIVFRAARVAPSG